LTLKAWQQIVPFDLTVAVPDGVELFKPMAEKRGTC
jgi:hypothetical protein